MPSINATEARHGHATSRWLDGLSEAIGLLSLMIFAISASAFSSILYLAYMDRDFFTIIAALFFGGPGVLLSTVGTLFGFRSYPRAVIVLAFLQIPFCCLVIVVGTLLYLSSF